MRDRSTPRSDNQETIRATEILAKEGFVVMPYMYPDLYAARDLVNAGAACIMPLAAPIGTNKGLATRDFIKILIDEIDLPIIVDAGIGRPSQACEAMEMGAAAIMANTAIATAGDIPAMAGRAFGIIEPRPRGLPCRSGPCTRNCVCLVSADRIFTGLIREKKGICHGKRKNGDHLRKIYYRRDRTAAISRAWTTSARKFRMRSSRA